MPRRRSSIIKKANPSWHGIECLSGKEFLKKSERIEYFHNHFLTMHKRLEIEVGSGSGQFLLASAKKNPGTLFVGIEYASRFLKYVRDQVEKEGLKNILLIYADARLVLERCLPEKSVDAYHFYFPDPWPKASQQKRRSLGQRGLSVIQKTLKPNGILYFTTDHQGYAEEVEEILSEFSSLQVKEKKMIQPKEMKEPSFIPAHAAYGGGTHFGEKFIKERKTIYQFVIERRPSETSLLEVFETYLPS